MVTAGEARKAKLITDLTVQKLILKADLRTGPHQAINAARSS